MAKTVVMVTVYQFLSIVMLWVSAGQAVQEICLKILGCVGF